MKLKNILIGAGIIGTGITGYKIGKVVAYFRSVKYGLSGVKYWLELEESVYPGFTKMMAQRISDGIIDFIFDEKEKESQ